MHLKTGGIEQRRHGVRAKVRGVGNPVTTALDILARSLMEQHNGEY
jgi:hypothetical protein